MMSHSAKANISVSSDGLVIVDVNPDFVISIASSDIRSSRLSSDRKSDRHWTSKSARSWAVRRRFSELPYYVPEPHSLMRRHSSESWPASDTTSNGTSFSSVVKTAERLSSLDTECTSSVLSDEPLAKIVASVSITALATCGTDRSSGDQIASGLDSVSRSRSLGDLRKHWSDVEPVCDVSACATALQSDALIDKVEHRLKNFHVS